MSISFMKYADIIRAVAQISMINFAAKLEKFSSLKKFFVALDRAMIAHIVRVKK